MFCGERSGLAISYEVIVSKFLESRDKKQTRLVEEIAR
jgi:hypothetical protein